MIKKKKLVLIFILSIVSLALISAFVIEYGLGHKPCKLCIYQRIPYIFSIFLISYLLFLEKYQKIIFLLLALIFIASALLAFYHFGIEQDFFSETLICEDENNLKNLTKEQLLEQIKKNSISCKDVSFRIMGLSLATINTIFSFILSVIFIKYFLNYEKN